MKSPAVLAPVLAGLLASAPAAAQSPSTPVGPPVVVTATRFADDLDRPVNVTVIGPEEIRASTARTLPELLGAQAGIQARDLFGNNASSTVLDLRGFGATGGQNTLILLDGRRISDIDTAGVQWGAIPLSAVERVEIVRGGGAVQWGEGASAGVINIITRRPDSVSGAEVRAGAASYSTAEGAFSGSLAGDAVALRITGSHFDSEGYRDNNANRQRNALADLRARLGEGELTVQLTGDAQDIRLPGFRQVQPSTGVNQLADRRGTPTPNDYATRAGEQLALGWRAPVAGGEFQVDLSWRDKAQQALSSTRQLYLETDLKLLSLSPRLRLPLPGLPGAHTLALGVDVQSWDYRQALSDDPTHIDRPVNVIRARQLNRALWGQDSMRFATGTTLTLGLRAETVANRADDSFDSTAPGATFGSGAPAASDRATQRAWELGLRQELAPGLALVGHAGKSFRFATVDEIYEFSSGGTVEFQYLRPQRARTLEAALEGRQGPAAWRAGVFRMDVRDEIHLDAFTFGVGNTNLPPSRRTGLELEGSWRDGPLYLRGAWTYTRARFLEGVFPGTFGLLNNQIAGKSVPLVPRNKLDLAAALDLGRGTRLSLGLSALSSQYMENDEANDLGVRIPGYAVADLKLVHQAGAWRLAAAVNNLFDKEYFAYAVKSQFVADRYNAYPLPERNLSLSAEYAF